MTVAERKFRSWIISGEDGSLGKEIWKESLDEVGEAEDK